MIIAFIRLWFLTVAFIGLAQLRAMGQNSAVPQAEANRLNIKAVPVSSRIVAVTVYSDSALVTREVDVPANKGLMELEVGALPAQVVGASLYSESGEAVRVLATRFRTRQSEVDVRKEVREIEEQQKKMKATGSKLQAELKALEGNVAFLAKLEGFATANVTGATEKGKLDSEQVITLGKFVMDGRATKALEITTLQEKILGNTEQLGFLQRRLDEAGSNTVRTERDAVMVVEKLKDGPAKVRLNYLVGQAGWRPQYRLRVGTKAMEPSQLEYLASVNQQTGEDWGSVQLTLSNAQPMLNASPPELKALALSIVPRPVAPPSGALPTPRIPGQQGAQAFNFAMPGSGYNALPNPSGLTNSLEINGAARQLRFQAQKEMNSRSTKDSSEIFNYAGALEQADELVLTDEFKRRAGEPIAVGPREVEGPSLTYPLKGAFSLTSRSDEQVLEIARLELPGELFFKAVPVLTPHVYRQARFVNKTRMVLLPGEASMYFGGDFVGKHSLPLVAMGEQFTVGLGAEPQLQVARKLVDKSKTMQGGNQVLKYEYRILVSSYRTDKIKLQVWDRLPMTEGEAVGVTPGKIVPELSQDPLYLREERPRNLLRWDLEVNPDANGEKALTISYDFRIELDTQKTIGTFSTR
jgi:hypothetical protein